MNRLLVQARGGPWLGIAIMLLFFQGSALTYLSPDVSVTQR